MVIISQLQTDSSVSKSRQQAWKSFSQASDQEQWSGISWTHDLRGQEQCSGNTIPQTFSSQTCTHRSKSMVQFTWKLHHLALEFAISSTLYSLRYKQFAYSYACSISCFPVETGWYSLNHSHTLSGTCTMQGIKLKW